MLSRVADSLFWMARYLERAEHTARLLDVHLHSALDLTPTAAERRWRRLLLALHSQPPAAGVTPYAITQALTFDMSNSDSIAACITTARDNARQVRERISSEMWEQVTASISMFVIPRWMRCGRVNRTSFFDQSKREFTCFRASPMRP